MAGLNNLLSDTQQTSTTLPSWYDAAQQNIVSQGTQAAAQAPQLGQTTAQQAINTLQGPANPFTQAQNTLQQISSGAANPWITDASGNVTPNTNTALGGLFQAENQQLRQMIPQTVAPAAAAGIGAGQFGSLRTQTAENKALADAQSQLFAQQMAAALQNQQTGQQAATNLGNVGQQGITSEMNVGLAQQNAPFTNVSNLSNLLASIQAPTTVSSQKQLSGLGQITAIGNALQGGLGALGSTAVGKNILGALGLGTSSPALAANNPAGTYNLTGGGTLTINPDGTQYTKDASGNVQYYDKSGNPVSNTDITGGNYGPTPDGGNIVDTTGISDQ